MTRRIVMLSAAVSAWTAMVFFGFYPGLMSADPFSMLDQALAGSYSTTHSPLLSFMLGLVYRSSGSVWPALLIQLLAFGTALAVLAYRAERFGLALAVFLAALFAPTTWSIMAAIWKDVAMATTLLLGVLALVLRRPWWALALFAAAGTMRLNALLAAAPLVVFASSQLAARFGSSTIKRYAILLACLVAVAAAPRVVQRSFKAAEDWTLAWVLIDDLAAIYTRKPELFPGSVLESEVSAEDLSRMYNVGTSVSLFYGSGKVIRLESSLERRAALKAEWARLVSTVPTTYLRTRLARFRRLLGLDREPVHYPFHSQIDPNPYGLTLRKHTALHRALGGVRDGVKDSLLFRGWFWLGGLLSLTVVAVRKRRTHPLALWVALSGLAYAAGYLPLAPAADFRYLFWCVVAVSATALLLLAREAPQQR